MISIHCHAVFSLTNPYNCLRQNNQTPCESLGPENKSFTSLPKYHDFHDQIPEFSGLKFMVKIPLFGRFGN